MATGQSAKSGSGPWLRGFLFAAMACGAWWLWVTLGMAARFSGRPDPISVAAIVLGILNFIAVMFGVIEGGLADRGLRGTVRWLPLALWAEMTDDGDDVRLWAILVWPLLVPAEIAVCLGAAVGAVLAGASQVLNIRLK